VFVFQRMYFVYACSTNVLVNKDWYIYLSRALGQLTQFWLN